MNQLITEVQWSATHAGDSKGWISIDSDFLDIHFIFCSLKMMNKYRVITTSKYFNSMQAPRGKNYNVFEQSM